MTLSVTGEAPLPGQTVEATLKSTDACAVQEGSFLRQALPELNAPASHTWTWAAKSEGECTLEYHTTIRDAHGVYESSEFLYGQMVVNKPFDFGAWFQTFGTPLLAFFGGIMSAIIGARLIQRT